MRRCYCGNHVTHLLVLLTHCLNPSPNPAVDRRPETSTSTTVFVVRRCGPASGFAMAESVSGEWGWAMIYFVGEKCIKTCSSNLSVARSLPQPNPVPPPPRLISYHHHNHHGVTLRIVIVPPSINSFGQGTHTGQHEKKL